ncbi:MAG: hypothetical protein E6G97_20275 [Alphaproteobacteria bacterium]|nr:MAG: hypothetical protein E6G97_20275 [Alphaproteobacteria bacterium]
MMKLASKPRPGPYRPRKRGIRITDKETEALIRKLAAVTGETIEIAVLKAVNEKHKALDHLMRHRVEWSRRRRPRKPRPIAV